MMTALASKEVSSLELTNAYLDRIEAVEDKVDAYLTVTAKEAREKAKQIDEKRAKGEVVSDFAGLPISVKDNICTKDMKTTCASKMLENFIPPYDATVMKQLNEKDFVLLGKLNMDEFAMGGSTENSAFKKTKNPHDVSRVPGGSSGGSAAAVAAKMTPLSLGSDTGGSIRQPASYCGVVGMKPTYGRVSRFGLVAFASSLDQIGPLGQNVEDVALAMNAISGYDRYDSTSAPIEVPDFSANLQNDIRGKKIALPKEFFAKGLDQEVKEAVLHAAKEYEKLGAIVEEVSFDLSNISLPAYYLISSAEASSNLARYDGIKYGHRAKEFDNLLELYKNTRDEAFGKEVKRRILLGTYALSSGYYDAYYKKAQQVRTLIKNEFNSFFETYEAILTPTAPTTAFKFGENTENPIEMYLNDIYTVPLNIAGVPGISVNCGFDSKGMPIGMQLIGKAFDEATLLNLAYQYEQNATFEKKAIVLG